VGGLRTVWRLNKDEFSMDISDLTVMMKMMVMMMTKKVVEKRYD
jgi:hypothetical protein